MSVLTELLRIKEYRESQAETEAQRRRRRLEDVVRALEDLQRKLEEFRVWSLEHERGLYAELCTRLVKLREIEQLRNRVAELRNEERNLEQRVLDVEQERRKVARELAEALELLREAGKKKNKFVELARIYSDEARRELERKEELELEEFRSSDGKDDWGYEDDDADALLH